MRCDGFDMRLQHVMDRRRVPDQDRLLREHAAECARCRRQLLAASRVLEGLELLEVPSLSGAFTDRVLDRFAACQTPTRWATRRIAWALALAGMVLLAFIPMFRSWWGSDWPELARSTAPTASSSPAAFAPLTDASGVATGWDRQGWWVVPPELIEDLYPEETRERHRQRVSELAEDLRPIASPFNAAVAALRWTLPVGWTREKSDARATYVPGERSRRWS